MSRGTHTTPPPHLVGKAEDIVPDHPITISSLGVRDVYLDCVDAGGFLPAFYERLGFAKVCERSITYSSGNTFPMVLMKKELNYT